MGGRIFLVILLSLCNLVYSNVFDAASNFFHSTADSVSNYYCNLYECCKEVPYDLRSLQFMLNTRLYGQPIAADIILNAINSHMRKLKSRKPLVLSFHGANGVGKTYVSRMIAKAFFKRGENSRYFHFYYGLDNFPLKEKVSEYQMQLKYEIEAAISSCERSLFVFDGVDQMPAGLLNVLMPFIDCPSCVGKDKKNKSIFIFLTNTGSLVIQKQLQMMLKDGMDRQNMTIQNFEKVIISETFNINGGLFESLMIKADAIDFYVPFLPLERQHVELCIRETFEELNTNPTTNLIEEVFQELRFGPEPENLFSNSGCKRVAQIAGRIVSRLEKDFDDFHLDL